MIEYRFERFFTKVNMVTFHIFDRVLKSCEKIGKCTIPNTYFPVMKWNQSIENTSQNAKTKSLTCSRIETSILFLFRLDYIKCFKRNHCIANKQLTTEILKVICTSKHSLQYSFHWRIYADKSKYSSFHFCFENF